MRAGLIAVAILVAAACGGTALPTTFAHVPSLKGKAAAFDDVEIDQAAQVVYAADRTASGVDVFDVSGPLPRWLRTIALPAPPNGLALAPAQGRVYAGTAGGAVEVIDTSTDKVTAEVKTGASEIDLLDFAPGRNVLYASTGADGSLLTIDASTLKITSTAKIGKPLEQPRFDAATNSVYVAVPELDELAVVNASTGAVGRPLKLGGCIPTGLAINPALQTALVACRKSAVAYDLRTGQKDDFGRLADGDVVQYYPAVDRFFVTSPHEQVPTIVAMFGGDPVGYVGSVHVDGGGNAAVYDVATDHVYTTDPRAAGPGLTGFQMDGTRPIPLMQTLLTTVVPAVLLGILVLGLWLFIGRRADPANRKRPALRPVPAVVLAKPPDRLTPSP